MTEQDPSKGDSMGDVAQKAEHKQQAYESNKRLKTSLQAVSSDRGKPASALAVLSSFAFVWVKIKVTHVTPLQAPQLCTSLGQNRFRALCQQHYMHIAPADWQQRTLVPC